MLEQGQNNATPAPPSGPECVGRYELVERIGDGGMAEVHLARRLGVLPFQRPIAVVKKIHPHLARNKQFIDFLLDEARVSALIKHPRVIDMYDVGVSRGVYFIATEHLSGQPLQALFDRGRAASRGTGSFLDVYSTARIIADAADGVHAAHELRSLTGRPLELVHRDVAPKNIMVLYDGSVKLVDVGIARAWAAVPERDLATGYLSPEQMDRRTVDRRSDIFSLGVVMWEALAGTRLFEGRTVTALLGQIARGAMKPPSEHRPEVPDALDKICMRALAAEPGERFQTASEMRAALESLLEDTSFRRSSGGLASFMADVFAAERQAQQEQIERASEPAPRASEPKRPAIPGGAAEGEVPDTLVRMPDELTGPLALGSQHIPLPAPPDAAGNPLVPPPEPLPRERERERAAARRRASAALAAVARSAPLPAGGGRPTGPVTGAGGPAPVARSESPMAPGIGVPPTEPTVPGARAAGTTPSTSDAPVAGTGVVQSSSTSIESGSTGSRPRGKGRPGRIDSIADAWTDRRQAGRSLPLPAPPKVAVGTQSDASITGVGAEPEEDDDDFTFVDPEKSLRSFESGALSAVAAGDKTASKVLDTEMVSPILTGRRSRWIWTAGFVALGATGLVSALLYTALGGGDRRIDGSRGGEGAILPPAAQRSLSDTVPADPGAEEASPSKSAAATTTSPSHAGNPAGSAKVAEPSVPASPRRADPSLAAASDRETRPAPSSPVAGPRSRPAAPPPAAPPPAAPPPAAPPEPAIAAAPVPRPGASGAPRTDSRAESARRTRPAPARKLTRPEPQASPDDLYRDGARLYLDGKLDEARRKFQTAIDSAPRFAPAHRGLGLVYERMGQKGRAIRSWQAYLRIAPGAADADLIRARIERLTR